VPAVMGRISAETAEDGINLCGDMWVSSQISVPMLLLTPCNTYIRTKTMYLWIGCE